MMRREARQRDPLDDPWTFRLAEAARRLVVAPVVLRAAARAPLGSRSWHRFQERLARRGSVGTDIALRNAFLTATLPGNPKQLWVLPDVNICYPRNLHLGANVFINRGVCIDAPERVSIGDACLIGPYVVINSGNHSYEDPDKLIRDQGHARAPIVIGDDVWLGAHVVVLAGVTIGSGAVVAAGSVVTESVAPYSVVRGAPARVVKVRGRECVT